MVMSLSVPSVSPSIIMVSGIVTNVGQEKQLL